MKKISVVIPVLNEEAFVEKCLASVTGFVLPSGYEVVEVLVIDGGSIDKTEALVLGKSRENSKIKLLKNPQKIQSTALNIAIREFAGDFLVRLDAHAVYPADYLLNCVRVMEFTNADNVGGVVSTMPGGDSYGAQVVQALTTHKFGVGNSGFRTGETDTRADTVPFGFFKRSVFKEVGYFDERLVRAQDYEFNRRINKSGGVIWLNSKIQTLYFNQATFWGFLKKQIFREAPYNAYMWYLAPYAFAWRHAVTALFVIGVFLGLALWSFPPVRSIYLGVLLLYCILAAFSAFQQALRFKEFRHLFVLPVCFLAYHFVHGVGVIVGVLRLLVGMAPVQQCREPWPGAKQFRAWPPPDGKSWSSSLNIPN